jgi:hypothetical protein
MAQKANIRIEKGSICTVLMLTISAFYQQPANDLPFCQIQG